MLVFPGSSTARSFLAGLVIGAAALGGYWLTRVVGHGSAVSLELYYLCALLLVVLPLGIARVQLREEALRTESLTDMLTGLPNRRAGLARLGQELVRARRYEHPLTTLVVDFDRLKRLNDRYGHSCGDRALRQVAQCMKSTCRTSDMLTRYAGDEFLLIAPMTTEDQGRELALRLGRGVSEQFLLVDGQEISLSASFGVAEARGNTETVDDLFAAADADLYRAKRARRSEKPVQFVPIVKVLEKSSPPAARAS